MNLARVTRPGPNFRLMAVMKARKMLVFIKDEGGLSDDDVTRARARGARTPRS